MSVDGPVIVNGAEFAIRAAADGVGLAYVPAALAAPFLRSELIRVLEKSCPAVDGLFLRHAGHREIPAALRALIDMICQAPHPAGPPYAMPGQIGPAAWRSSADIAAKAA